MKKNNCLTILKNSLCTAVISISIVVPKTILATDAVETNVKITITQNFVTDAERNANRRKFEGMAQVSNLRIKEREGVWTKISTSGTDISELLEMSRNFKDVLKNGVIKIEQLRLNARLDAYYRLMEQVVRESKSESSELLMRYALNRGMATQELFAKEWSRVRTNMSQEALKALELRVLRDAVNRAITLYEKDEKFLDVLRHSRLDKDKEVEMKSRFGFGLFEVSKLEYERDYANYIIELTTNAPTHNGTFQLLKFTVVQLFNGINSSLLRNQSKRLKNILINLYELGVELPEEAPSDTLAALSLNNMTKDALDRIIIDYGNALVSLKKELAEQSEKLKIEFARQKKEQEEAARLKKLKDEEIAELNKRKEEERAKAQAELEKNKARQEFWQDEEERCLIARYSSNMDSQDRDFGAGTLCFDGYILNIPFVQKDGRYVINYKGPHFVKNLNDLLIDAPVAITFKKEVYIFGIGKNNNLQIRSLDSGWSVMSKGWVDLIYAVYTHNNSIHIVARGMNNTTKTIRFPQDMSGEWSIYSGDLDLEKVRKDRQAIDKTFNGDVNN